jgi:hypothetical protein
LEKERNGEGGRKRREYGEDGGKVQERGKDRSHLEFAQNIKGSCSLGKIPRDS